MPRVPLTCPELLFEVEVPPPWSDFLARPIVGGDAVLLAGDAGRAVAVDCATGQRRWELDLPVEGVEAYTGLPLPLAGGGALVPEYQKDTWLRVHHVTPAGAIAFVDDLAGDDPQRRSDLEIAAFDGGCKLFLLPLARGAGDDYLISWIYRQIRFYHTECRSLRGEARWASPEAMLATTGDVVLGVTVPARGTADQGTLVARDKRGGALLWSLPATDHTVVCAAGELFLVLDRTARLGAIRARESDVDEALLRALEADPSLEGEALERLEQRLVAERPVLAPSRLLALDARSGAERWRAELAGDVASIRASEGLVVAVAAEGAEVRIHRVDARTGARLGSSSPGSSWPMSPVASRIDPSVQLDSWAEKLPIVAAVDASAIVWAGSGALVAERVLPPFEVLWRAPLPVSCRSFQPRRVDRVLGEVAIALGEDRLYLRDGARLLSLGAPRG